MSVPRVPDVSSKDGCSSAEASPFSFSFTWAPTTLGSQQIRVLLMAVVVGAKLTSQAGARLRLDRVLPGCLKITCHHERHSNYPD